MDDTRNGARTCEGNAYQHLAERMRSKDKCRIVQHPARVRCGAGGFATYRRRCACWHRCDA